MERSILAAHSHQGPYSVCGDLLLTRLESLGTKSDVWRSARRATRVARVCLPMRVKSSAGSSKDGLAEQRFARGSHAAT